jgi:hypothetical protein
MLIGILGEAGSGKDEAAQHLVKTHGFYSLALADPIKVYCGWLFDWPEQRLYGESRFRNAPDSRYPFYRCPACGFTMPGIRTAIDLHASSLECLCCGGLYPPERWASDLSPRFALQSLGDWARNLNAEAYVNFAIERCNRVLDAVDQDPLWDCLERLKIAESRWTDDPSAPAEHVVISDVRLKNELKGIRLADGKVIRIRREARECTTTTGIPKHNSEMEQREIPDGDLDGIIENNGTLDEMYSKLQHMIMT